MRKVAPSVLRREELDRLLQAGAAPGDNIISELVSTVTRLVVQELLEAEQTDFWVAGAATGHATTMAVRSVP